jgi:hypothetical protein
MEEKKETVVEMIRNLLMSEFNLTEEELSHFFNLEKLRFGSMFLDSIRSQKEETVTGGGFVFHFIDGKLVEKQTKKQSETPPLV